MESARYGIWAQNFSRLALTLLDAPPLPHTPVWATLTPVPGGLLYPQRLAVLGQSDSPNEALCTAAGVAHLGQLLESGQYDLLYPEHGALLSAVWLAKNGRVDRAREILSALGPFARSFRFYPVRPSACWTSQRATLGGQRALERLVSRLENAYTAYKSRLMPDLQQAMDITELPWVPPLLEAMYGRE